MMNPGSFGELNLEREQNMKQLHKPVVHTLYSLPIKTMSPLIE